jgi:hypothetical protein
MAAAVNYYFYFFLNFLFFIYSGPIKSNTNSIRKNLGINLKIYLRTNANAYETKLGMHLKTYAHTNTNNKKKFSGINLKKYAPSYARRVSKSRDAWDLVIYAWIFFNASSKFLNFSTRITLLGSRTL